MIVPPEAFPAAAEDRVESGSIRPAAAAGLRRPTELPQSEPVSVRFLRWGSAAWRLVFVAVIVVLMSWLGANARPAAVRLAGWLSGQAVPDWLPLASSGQSAVTYLLVHLGEPLLIVMAFVALEAVLGLRPRFDRVQVVTWGCFLVMWLTHALLTRWLHFHVSPWLPVGAFDMASLMPRRTGGVIGNALNFLAYLLMTDFVLYWLHRWSHANPVLWKFHSVHHSYSDLNALNSLFHPAEVALRVAVVFPILMMVNFSESALPWIVVGFYFVHDRLVHTKAPVGFGGLSMIVCDNRLHFTHHSRDRGVCHANYATLFPVFDMIYGTYRPPSGQGLCATGIEGYEQPRSIRHFITATLGKSCGEE